MKRLNEENVMQIELGPIDLELLEEHLAALVKFQSMTAFEYQHDKTIEGVLNLLGAIKNAILAQET